jgi:predicted DNA-binding protein
MRYAVSMEREQIARLTLDLPAEMRRRLKVLAAQRGVSMKALIMAWIEAGLNEAAGAE